MDSADQEHFDRRASNPRKPTVVPRASSGRNRIDRTPSCCNASTAPAAASSAWSTSGMCTTVPERSTRNQKRCASIGSSRTGVVRCGTSGAHHSTLRSKTKSLVDLQARRRGRLRSSRTARRDPPRRHAESSSRCTPSNRVDIDVTRASRPTRNRSSASVSTQPRFRFETRVVDVVCRASVADRRPRSSRALPCLFGGHRMTPNNNVRHRAVWSNVLDGRRARPRRDARLRPGRRRARRAGVPRAVGASGGGRSPSAPS